MERPKNWAIVIGVNQYHFMQPLSYAKRDAEVMRDFLLNQAGFDRVFCFTDDSPPEKGKSTEPFRANLRMVMQEIFSQPFMGNGDNFWFFFSGHGVRHSNQDYLMPLDGNPKDVEETAIPTHYITQRLRNCGADNVVMILDACRNQNQKSGEGIGRQTELEVRQTGVITIFSCNANQCSYEIPVLEQGAFTAALVEGLGIRGHCATAKRLHHYLEWRVPALVQEYCGNFFQSPYVVAEPITKADLILVPKNATETDLAILKNDAFRTEFIDGDLRLAKKFWRQVLAISLGQDEDAISAVGRIEKKIDYQNEKLKEYLQIPESSVNLKDIWRDVVAHLQPPATQALTRQQCRLLSFSGKEAVIGVNSRPLYKLAQSRLPNLEAAFQQAFQKKVKVRLEITPMQDL